MSKILVFNHLSTFSTKQLEVEWLVAKSNEKKLIHYI